MIRGLFTTYAVSQEQERGFCHILICFVFFIGLFFSDKGGGDSNFFNFRLTSYVNDPLHNVQCKLKPVTGDRLI